jgi:hypothetical protein
MEMDMRKALQALAGVQVYRQLQEFEASRRNILEQRKDDIAMNAANPTLRQRDVSEATLRARLDDVEKQKKLFFQLTGLEEAEVSDCRLQGPS